jgi:chemotaxis protein histidine kinase CheA
LNQELTNLQARFDATISRAGVAAQNTIFDNMRAAGDSAARQAELDRKADESRRADAALQAFQAYDRADRAVAENRTPENEAAAARAEAKLNEALAMAPAEANRRIAELMMRREQQAINQELTRARAKRQETESELNQAKIELAKARAARNEAAIAQNDEKIKLLEAQLALQDRRVALASSALALRENQITVESMRNFSRDLQKYITDDLTMDRRMKVNIGAWAAAFYALNPLATPEQIASVLEFYYSLPVEERHKALGYDRVTNRPVEINIGGLPNLRLPPGFGVDVSPPEPRSGQTAPAGGQTPAAQGRASLRNAPTDTQQQPRRALPPDITDMQGVLGLDSLGAFP